MKKATLTSILSVLALAVSAHAAPTYVQVDGYRAAAILSPLLSAGKQFTKESSARYVLDINQLSCVMYSHAASDSLPIGGIPTTTCTESQDRKLKEAGALLEALRTALSQAGYPYALDDCGMGKCYGKLKQIHCVVNPTVERYDSAARMLCKLFF